MSYRWEWLSTTSNNQFEWTIYQDKIHFILNESVKANSKNADFEVNDVKFQVCFKTMSQKNVITGYERPIRLCINLDEENDNELDEDKKSCWYYWQWLNESNKWITYSADITIELENNYFNYLKNNKNSKLASFKISIKELKASYLIDFVNMTQINEKSKYSRKIKRIASDLTNIKTENESIEEGPSSNLRKRKAINYNDKQLSSSSTVSVVSDKSDENEDNSSKASKSGSKRLRKIRDMKPENIKEEPKEEIEKDEAEEKPKTSKSAKKKANLKREKIEEEDEPESKKSKSSKNKKESIKKEEDISEPEETIKTIKFNGEIPLDEKFTEVVGIDYKIYREEDVVFDCMLNQTNLQYNNNKYYLIQLVEHLSTKTYLVWMRWGRVGKPGQFSSHNFGNNLNEAKDMFTKKFLDKTKNEWDLKDSFVKYPGKYDLVEKDYGSVENKVSSESDPIVKKEEPKKETVPSKLDKRIQDIIDLICNISEMESLLKEMKYDAKKSPLGKLSKGQIKAGYASLKEIEQLINSKASNRQLIEACNEFYTRIPHDFGMKVPPVINTLAQIREKMKLLEILDDVEVAIKVLNQKSDIDNPIDRHYDQLDCKLKPIDKTDKMYKIIEDYLFKTHAPTHNNYKFKLLDIFEAEKPGENEKFKDYGNRMLLWHGSRITNWAGILSKGLRIAPPEAPVTGYMFGKGCYFADCSSKSANYCYPTSTKNVGLLSLSEVSLGACNELKQADYDADKLPKGKMSTKGLGRSEPDKKEWVTLDDGCVVPCGKLVNSVGRDVAASYSLLYNEFIVYNVDQIKLRYLVKVEFDFED